MRIIIVMMTIAIIMLVIKAMVMKMLMKHYQLWWWGWSEPWIRARGTLDLNVDKRKRIWLGFSFCLTSYSDWKLRGWGGEKLFRHSWFCFRKRWQRCWLICYLFCNLFILVWCRWRPKKIQLLVFFSWKILTVFTFDTRWSVCFQICTHKTADGGQNTFV